MVCRHRLGEPEPSGLPDRCPWRVLGGTSLCAWRRRDRGAVRLVDCPHRRHARGHCGGHRNDPRPGCRSRVETRFLRLWDQSQSARSVSRRFTMAGAKDDRRDAHVLADSLRTDRPHRARCWRHLQLGRLFRKLDERRDDRLFVVALVRIEPAKADQFAGHVRRNVEAYNHDALLSPLAPSTRALGTKDSSLARIDISRTASAYALLTPAGLPDSPGFHMRARIAGSSPGCGLMDCQNKRENAGNLLLIESEDTT